jgi:hypothetical protein
VNSRKSADLPGLFLCDPAPVERQFAHQGDVSALIFGSLTHEAVFLESKGSRKADEMPYLPDHAPGLTSIRHACDPADLVETETDQGCVASPRPNGWPIVPFAPCPSTGILRISLMAVAIAAKIPSK